MTGPIIPAELWPEWADRHCWDKNGSGVFYGPLTSRSQVWLSVAKLSNIPMPEGWDWRVPVMRQAAPAIDLGKLRAFAESVIDRGHRWDCESRHRADNRCDCGMGQTKQEAKDLLALIDGQARCEAVSANVSSSSAHSEDFRIARIIAEKIDEGRLDHPGFYKNGRLSEALRNILALIDGRANVRSSSEHSDSLTPVAHKKLQGLQADGFIVNGLAIFNPATGRRGLVDYLGYVGWQASEQPSVAPVGVEGLMQLAREWCMSWGEWAHDADPGCAKENAAEAVLRAALTQALAQQPSKAEGE